MLHRKINISNVGHVTFDLPEICPRCGSKFSPNVIYMERNDRIFENINLGFSGVLSCKGCSDLLVTSHTPEVGKESRLIKCEPIIPTPQKFEDVVSSISPTFIEIYNQSKAAEEYGLDHIAGMGYRKALEFLIKDFAIKMDPEKEEVIKAELLGPCIKKYIDDKYVKQTAKAASWIGNDETHYQRRTEDKDIGDLKRYLESCLFFIMAIMNTRESEEMTSSPSTPE